MCSCSSSPPVYVLCIAVVVVFIQAVVVVGRVLAVAAQLCVFVPECAIVFVAHDLVRGLHRDSRPRVCRRRGCCRPRRRLRRAHPEPFIQVSMSRSCSDTGVIWSDLSELEKTALPF